MRNSAKRPSLSISDSPESPKRIKAFIQTTRNKPSSAIATPRTCTFRPKHPTTSSSNSKTLLGKYITPSTTTFKMSSIHKHSFSELITTPSVALKKVARKPSFSPEKKPTWKAVSTPTDPDYVLKNFFSSLSLFEQTEIVNFPRLYCIGEGVSKIKTVSVNNFGFDDEKGDYRIMLGDHIAYRYEIKTVLGKGSFGQVVGVYDHKEKTDCAIKIIKNKPRFHQQALVEIDILAYLREKDPNDVYCIVHMQQHFLFRRHMVSFT
jgi:hypothetical protein